MDLETNVGARIEMIFQREGGEELSSLNMEIKKRLVLIGV